MPPDRLNSFGLALLRVEAERLQDATEATQNGWRPGDHPERCCPQAPEPITNSGAKNPAAYWTARAESARKRIETAEAELARLEAQGEPGVAHNNWRRRQATSNRQLDWLHRTNKLRRDIPRLRSLADDYRAKAATARKDKTP